MNFYLKDNKHTKKKSCIMNIFFYLLKNGNKFFLIFFFVITIFFSLFFWMQPINYKIINKYLFLKDNKITTEKLNNLNISDRYTRISKFLFHSQDKINIFNIHSKNLKLKNSLISSKLFNSDNFRINNLFNQKKNYQQLIEKKLPQNIEKLKFVNSANSHIIFSTLDVSNESSVPLLIRINKFKNFISEDLSDAIISVISSSVPNLSKKNIAIISQFEKKFNSNKNFLYTQTNYQNINLNRFIINKYKNQVKKNLLSKVIKKINYFSLIYINDFNKLHKRKFSYLQDLDFFKKIYILKNNFFLINTITESKKNYGLIIFSNSCKKYGNVEKRFDYINLFQKKKINFKLNKKKLFSSIILSKSNLENSNNKFNHLKLNSLLDIGEITNLSIIKLINYKKSHKDKYLPIIDHRIFNIKNLMREVAGFSVFRNDSIEMLNCNFSEPETPIIQYIPIKKNESFDRTLHLVPWFILFFFIVLLITSFYSFKKLTKKIEDSNISIIYNIKNSFENSKKYKYF
jgi:flagellar biosynthesis/type III secretory pathway M-ring protein FliF/YscJ